MDFSSIELHPAVWPVVGLFTLVACLPVGLAVYAAFFSPCRDIPVLYSYILRPWNFLPYIRRSQFHLLLWTMHSKLESPIIRAFRFVSVSDPDTVQRFLRIDDHPKAQRYDMLRKTLFNDRDNIWVTRDVDWHKMMRRKVVPAFSIKYLAGLETFMVSVWDTFEKKITRHKSDKRGWTTVDLNNEFQLISADVIGETAFGSSLGMIETETHPYHEGIKQLLAFMKARDFIESFVEGLVEKRRDLNSKGKSRPDILQMLLDAKDPETGEKMDSSVVATNAILFMAAGSETTGNSMMWTMYLLCKHPETLVRLRAELDEAFPNGLHEHLSHSTLKALPYLNAVLKETLRLKPVAPQILRQVDEDTWFTVPDKNGDPKKYFLPAGQMVLISLYSMHRDPKIWLRPNDFWPERWLISDNHGDDEDSAPSQATPAVPTYGHPVPVNKDAFLPFSIGSRDCIGRHFAWIEMREMVGHLVRRFDIEPAFDTSKDYVGCSMVTLQNREKDGLPVRLRPRADQSKEE